MEKKKTIVLTMIGVATLMLLVIGSAFAYFSLNSASGNSTSNFEGNLEDVSKYGKAYLNQGIDNLHINLKASDMAPGKIGTDYWATNETNESFRTNESNFEISTVGVTGSETEDIMYKCTSDLTITAIGNMTSEIVESDGRIYFGSSITTYGNSLVINPNEIDFKAVIDEQVDGGYKRKIEYTIIGNSKVTLTTDIKISNTEKDQTKIAGKELDINITNENLVCSVEKVNIAAPDNFDFYIRENNSEYTNDETNLVYITYEDNDVDSYCITEDDTADECVWTKVEGKTPITESYTFKDTNNGEKKLNVFLKDTGGNVSDKKEHTIILDKTIPTVSNFNIKTANNGYTSERNLKADITYSDEYGEIETYCVSETNTTDGCDFKEITDSLSEIDVILPEGEGNKKLYLFVKDKAGNVSLEKESNEVILDLNNPTVSSITLTGTAADTTQNTLFTKTESINVKLEYNDSIGVKEYCLMTSDTTDGCDWKTATTENINYTLPSGDGPKSIYAFVRDNANNISEGISKTITLDKTSPVLTAANFTLSSTGSTNVTATIGTVTETNPYKYCFRNGTSGNFACQTGKVKSFTVASGSKNTIYVYVQDKSGNVSTTINKTITLSLTPAQLVEKKPAFLSQSLVGGMHRYQGIGDVNNYICLGSECSENGKDLYRIIGITKEGELKVIKKTALTNGMKWHTVDTTDTEWPDSDLFHQLNDYAESEYGSHTYDSTSFYSTLSEQLKPYIVKKDWMYGDIDLMYTSSDLYDGNKMYNVETGAEATTHRVKNESDNNYTEQPYTWSKKVNAYIGLQYIHDYIYAYPNGNPGNYTTAKNAWIHISHNDTSNSNEWLISRYGYISSGSYYAWSVISDGYVANRRLAIAFAVRPVFYLSSGVALSGEGTLETPYTIF